MFLIEWLVNYCTAKRLGREQIKNGSNLVEGGDDVTLRQ